MEGQVYARYSPNDVDRLVPVAVIVQELAVVVMVAASVQSRVRAGVNSSGVDDRLSAGDSYPTDGVVFVVAVAAAAATATAATSGICAHTHTQRPRFWFGINMLYNIFFPIKILVCFCFCFFFLTRRDRPLS